MTQIGLFVPPKTGVTVPRGVPKGLLPPEVVEEVVSTLQQTPGVTCFTGLDFRHAVVKSGKVYIDDFCLSDLDLFFWYYSPEQNPAAHEVQMLKTLSRTTKVIPNPDGLIRGLDKFTSHTILRNAGVETTDFCQVLSSQLDELVTLFEEWGSMLLKPTLGAFGQGIVKIDSKQQLLDTVQYAISCAGKHIPVFCERFEANDMKKWISTTIIDGELVYGYRKRAEKIVDGWKVYDQKGIGGGTDYVDPAPVEDMVMKAAEALEADIIGFDCIYSTRLKRYLIVDENTFPGMYAHCFNEAGKGRWAEIFARMILNHAGHGEKTPELVVPKSITDQLSEPRKLSS